MTSSHYGKTNGKIPQTPKILILLLYFKWLVVRTAGLEPARPYGLEILSLLRLPFRQVRIRWTVFVSHTGRFTVLWRVLACWAVAASVSVAGVCV